MGCVLSIGDVSRTAPEIHPSSASLGTAEARASAERTAMAAAQT
jgi:hypothetical protein